jgi:mannose/cellobiose epimerase-like protein (N-acyl-D-glucosamine 2-epimerase family)
MYGRHIMGFCIAYQLSGEEKYLEFARELVDYLIAHGWDKANGGWYDSLTPTGQPSATTKSVPMWLYTDVGLAFYYHVTGDARVRDYLEKSIRIRRTAAHDAVYDGYYQVLNHDLSVKDDSKRKHSHFGYVGSLMVNVCLATRDPEMVAWTDHLLGLTMDHMCVPQYGWVLRDYERDWKNIPEIVDGKASASAGAQLTCALALLRFHEFGGSTRWRDKGIALAQ